MISSRASAKRRCSLWVEMWVEIGPAQTLSPYAPQPEAGKYPGSLLGLNELIEAERANRYKGAQLKKDAERRICAEIRRQLHGVHIRRPVMMRYLWVEPDRRRDRDNITGGRKFVQDALVRCKVLQNDGWKEIIGFSDDWAVDKARPRVEIEIIEMEG